MDLATNVILPSDGSETVLWFRSHDNLSDETYYHQVNLIVVCQGPQAHSGIPCVKVRIQTYKPDARCRREVVSLTVAPQVSVKGPSPTVGYFTI